jgi:hypothetical protein
VITPIAGTSTGTARFSTWTSPSASKWRATDSAMKAAAPRRWMKVSCPRKDAVSIRSVGGSRPWRWNSCSSLTRSEAQGGGITQGRAARSAQSGLRRRASG